MPRYPHFLQPAHGERWPRNVLCVACDSEYLDEPGLPARQSERLVSWTVLVCGLNADGYRPIATIRDFSAIAFWSELRRNSRKLFGAWILSFRCTRVLSLLGFWEQLESQSIEVCHHDPWETEIDRSVLSGVQPANAGPSRILHGSDMRRVLQRRCGLLICEDPPTIVRFRTAPTAPFVQWVDLRNYGAEVPKYCQGSEQEAQYLSEWITEYRQFCARCNLGSLQATAASQAMHGFRHSYAKTPIYCHNDARALAIERSGYYGGRCEAFSIGVLPGLYYVLDVSAMYPSLCSISHVPTLLSAVFTAEDKGPADFTLLATNGIADVTIQTDEPCYPYRRGSDVIWPIGRFRTTLAAPELYDAIHRGRVVCWHQLANYEVDYALRDYAEKLLAERMEDNANASTRISGTIKRISVALVGKLGQSERKWTNKEAGNNTIYYGNWWGSDERGNPTRYRAISGIVQYVRETGFAPDAVPAIAAWITSLGRMQLLRYIRKAGWANVVYVDTDSLIVNGEGYANLQPEIGTSGNCFGRLRDIFGQVAVEIRGIKHYVAGSRNVCAGRPNGYSQDVGDGRRYYYSSAPGDSIRRGQRPTAGRTLLTYTRSAEYRHGRVGADGRVHPWLIEE